MHSSHLSNLCTVTTGAGGHGDGAAGLREEVRDAAGRLARQLFDRNSQRPFAPAAAFAADGVQVRALDVLQQGSRVVTEYCLQAQSWCYRCSCCLPRPGERV